MPDPFVAGDPEDLTQPWYVRHRMRALLLTALIPLGVGVICFVTVWLVVQNGLKGHAVYAMALEAVRQDASVRAELGTPLEPGFMVTGVTDDRLGTAEIMFNLTGPAGDAGVRAVARRPVGETWRLTFLDVGAKLADGRDKVYKLIDEEAPDRFGAEEEQRKPTAAETEPTQ